MTHIALPWWPRSTSTTGSGGDDHSCSGTATATTTTAASSTSRSESAAPSMNCCGLSNLVRRLKRRSKMLHHGSRQSSFQCRYDPMSYSLNFDASGSGGDAADDEYYKFYAFSSRFVAAPPRTTDWQRLVAASH